MKAVVWYGARNVRLEEKRKPEAGPGKILVRMEAVGICGSDLKLFEYGVLGTFKPQNPFIMGHEGTGIVVETGAGVSGISTGDRVVINPQAACGDCFYCRQGAQNLCENLDFKSVTGDGVFSEYVVLRADQAIKLADHISFETGTAIEPLSVAVQAYRQVAMNKDDQVIVYGAGTIGLMVLAVLQEMGIKNIVVIDQLSFALEKAGRLGASAVINPKEKDIFQEIKILFSKHGPDVVFETAGSSFTQSQTFEIVRPGGTAVMVGITPDAVASANINRIVRSNLRVNGTVRTSGDSFVEAARLVNTGRIDPRTILDRVFPFEDAENAFKSVEDKNNCITKCVLRMGGDQISK